MAINQLIARGVAPIGQDLPQIGNMLMQRQQMQKQNALAEMAAQTDQTRANAFAQQVTGQQQSAQDNARREALQRSFDVVAQAPDLLPQFVGDLRQSVAPDLPENATLDQIALRLQLKAPKQEVPFDQTPDALKLNLQHRNAVELQERQAAAARNLEMLKQRAPKSEDAPKPVLTDVTLPDGSTQKQWLTPGAASGTAVGAPTKPATGLSKTQVGVAKQKLVSLRGLTTQIDKVQKSFDKLKGTYSAGPGAKVVTFTKAGRDFDKAVALLSPLVRQLTRVPGEGAMSDYETKLAQMSMPTRNEYEGTTQQQIDDLKDLIKVIDGGTRELLGEAPAAAGASGGWSAEELK